MRTGAEFWKEVRPERDHEVLWGALWSQRGLMGPLRTDEVRGGRGARALAHLTHHFS